jgi:para-nitrobenzyl esterase
LIMAVAATATESLVVRIKAGDLRGTDENGITVFRGVPYAATPVDSLRFSPPQPVPAWHGVRDATEDGPIPPQGRSRLAHIWAISSARNRKIA